MKEFAIGIDFGTTKTLVSWFNEETGRPETIRLGRGTDSLPTSIYISENGEMFFGADADDMIEWGIERYSRGLKMKLGVSQPVLVFKNGNGWTKYTALELTSFFLEYVRKRVEEEVFMGNKVTQAVITCPVLFSPMQREELKQAAMVAGFSKVVLANEPEAAGYAFCTMCSNEAFQGNALIVDWGGGTLDMALVYREGDHVCTRREHTAGDLTMGGEVFDEKLWDMVAQRVAEEKGIHLKKENEIVQYKLLGKVRQAKEMLSRNTEHKLLLASSHGPCHVVLNRGDFENLIGNDIDKASRAVSRLVSGIQGQSQKPELLLLVGGTSQIPIIEDRMKQASGLVCRKWQWSREAVSLGAALLAYRDVLSPQKTTSPENEKQPQKPKAAVDKPSPSPQVVTSPKRESSKPKPELPPLAVDVYLNLTEIMNGCTVSQVIEGCRVSIEISAYTLSLTLPAGTVPGKGKIGVSVKLLPGIDINKLLYEGSGLPVLQVAAKEGNRNMVRTAIRLGADVDADNGMALRLAVDNGHLEMVRELLDSGADVNANNGWPLRAATGNGHLEVVKELVRSGADVNLKQSDGKTALELAKTRGHTAIVSYLKEHGAGDSGWGCFILIAVFVLVMILVRCVG